MNAEEWSIFFVVMIHRIREPWICANHFPKCLVEQENQSGLMSEYMFNGLVKKWFLFPLR